MELIEKEEVLKNYLKSAGFDYGIGATHNRFIIQYLDNKSGATIRDPAYYHSPIDAIRILQDFCNQIKFPVQDVCINLIGVCNEDSLIDISKFDLELSPYLYYKRPEETKQSE